MAVVVTAASGFDLAYVWKNQAERSAGGYYINAALAGEPPGRWWGPGARALGFRDGQVVERGSYELVYRQVDPRTGEKLGRARGCYAKFADHLARLTATEPHATGERMVELERLAAQATRQSPAYTDLTVSFSKSISIFHASIRENERRARLAGDHAAAAWWAGAERRFQEVLHAANRAGLEHVQRWAGVTRTGYHGVRVDGQEPGRFEEGLVTVSSWLQGTSRDGDPQDHIHNQIARMVQTVRDGKWRALDTVCLRGVLGAVQAVVATHVECGLTAEFGVGWVPRADGAGNEIAGISREQMDAYSSRTVAINEKLPEAVASWTEKFGREPNRRELLYIRQEVTMTSREGKDAGVIDWDALTAKWDAQIGGALASVAPRVSDLRPGAQASAGAGASRGLARGAQRGASPGARAQSNAERATGASAGQRGAGPGRRAQEHAGPRAGARATSHARRDAGRGTQGHAGRYARRARSRAVRDARPRAERDARACAATRAQRRAGAGRHAQAVASVTRDGLTQAAVPVTRDGLTQAELPVTRDELAQAVQRGLALVQSAKATWTRADLMRQIGLVLPAGTRSMAPDDAVRLLDELTGEALAGLVEEVVCLEAPQWPPLPPGLVRELDGRSVYRRPGTTRYATRVQLGMEERLLRDAQREGAPCLGREQAAALLGADVAGLEAQLYAGAAAGAGVGGEVAGGGLRVDQAAALFWALTSARTAVVITGPAGSGKTRVLAAAGRAWREAGMGPVVGIATAQAARNVLAAAGVGVAENSAVFLGHLPGRRGARGVREIGAGTLLVIDEASMMSLPDLAEIVALAARRGAKVLIAGDQEQLAAVEAGGGMGLLARRLGYVQLAEAVRFAAGWERDASLRLRAGDASALDAYHEHGRITGAEPEQAMDDAVRRYVAQYLAGRDVLLMIADRERCREASRRIREDLIHLGLVDGGREVGLAEGARASAGDLIIARRNDHRLEAGEPGRMLANGDTLRVEAIGADGALVVRRLADCDPVSGERRFAGDSFIYRGYQTADLAYAVTGHSAQGRTVRAGIAVVTGAEDRRWLYVAMTRGSAENVVTVFTQSPRVADPEAGTRPAPELERHERVGRERAGLAVAGGPGWPAGAEAGGGAGAGTGAEAGDEADGGAGPRDAIAVAADILGHDDAEASALETWDRALANADHLAVLNAMWQGETAGLQAERFRRLVLAALPPEYAADGLASPRATWLWRTLRAAEAAGLDAAEVVREAVESRPLTGARDVAAVVDARIRWRTGSLVPLPAGPWSQRVPEVTDPEKRRFLVELAAAMDARKERIGEHFSEYPPGWAVRALGPVPGHPLDRLAWQRRAADIGAYRELYGYDHPDEPIGPEPAGDSPEKRAAWHAAFAALGPADGVDVRGLPDGSLLHMRGTYEAETAWAPRHVGRELRRIRVSAGDAELAAIRARAEEQVARQRGLGEVAERHAALARSWAAMAAFYRAQETELDQTMATRRDWEQVTEASRRLAVAADAELRRRHPERRLEPLRSAEPVIAEEERAQLLDLAPGVESYQTPEWIRSLAAERRAVHEQLADRASVRVPSADPDYGYEGLAWPAWPERDRDAILQPPRPEIRPAAQVAECALVGRDVLAGWPTEWEAELE